MKARPFKYCGACGAFLQWEVKDLEVRIPGQAYHIYCPFCNSTHTIQPQIAEHFEDVEKQKAKTVEVKRQEEREKQKTPPAKSPAGATPEGPGSKK